MTMTEAFVPGQRMHVPGAAAGPLAGLTFAVKDLIDVAGVPWMMGPSATMSMTRCLGSSEA